MLAASAPTCNDQFMTSPSGSVYLVGAGPGDPGLLTLRGADLLARADLVLYDGLVNPLLLRMTRGRCERTARVRDNNGPHVPQDVVNARLIEAARQGLMVVRLKGGDPFLFGRGGEEAAALAAAGIPCEIVPGVTAAIAAGEYAGISLTHRDLASAVAFITGHEACSSEGRVNYDSLARFPGTLVFYMGLHRLAAISESLLAAGLAGDTPAAVICRATLPDQRTVVAPLQEITQAAQAAGLRPPSLIVVGDCVRQRHQLAWFERRPLFGLRIGITRPEAPATQLPTGISSEAVDYGAAAPGWHSLDATLRRCIELGADPLPMPAIEIRPLDDWSRVDETLQRLREFDWLILTSAHGVQALMTRLWEQGGDARQLAHLRIACIGPATAAALAEWRLRADLIPESYRSEDLAEALVPQVGRGRVLWARATRGRDVLPSRLQEAGAQVESLPVYQHMDTTAFAPNVAEQLSAGELDWIALSSPAIARNVARMLPDAARPHLGSRTKLAAISPVTADAAREAGLPIAAIARDYTWDGVLEAIAAAVAASTTPAES